MALTVNFWTFSKRENSTAIPTGTPAISLSCAIKTDSAILSPVLEIGLSMAQNPCNWNYAGIPMYNRYYRVTDWQWAGGLWLCSLEVDPLASWKSLIGSSSHYILRSSYESNPAAVDEFYPALARKPELDIHQATFGFAPFDSGYYVLGIAGNGQGGCLTNHYLLTPGQASAFSQYLFKDPVTSWVDVFSNLTDEIYRSIYGPFDYIKSCRWFPLGNTSIGTLEYIMFGNYEARPDTTGGIYAQGYLIDYDNRQWPIYREVLSMPAGWIQMEAKYKTPPYGGLYLVFNPFGIIELSPIDFWNANSVVLELRPDYISGDGLLKIYKRTNEGDFFITEITSKLSVDLPITAQTINFLGAATSGMQAISSTIAALSAESGASMAIHALSAASSAAVATAALIPSMAASSGSLFGGPVAMDGIAYLVFTSTTFAPEDNADHGKPLLAVRQISNIPGYIQCAEGHIQIPGYKEEIDRINEFLTGGFFYE